MNLPQILIGCDPELFLRDRTTRKFVCADGVIPGTKKEPFKVEKGAVQVDGCAVEFNIDPAKNAEEFDGNISQVLAQLQGMLPGNLELAYVPTAHFDRDDFAKFPARALELGCEPDYNAYTGEQNAKPKTDKPIRTAAGHVHIGWTSGRNPMDPDHFADCREVVKQLDFYLGVPSVFWDKDRERQELYGKAGAFRPKEYGCEYRPLSCAWVYNHDARKYVNSATFHAINDLFNGRAARTNIGNNWAKNVLDKPGLHKSALTTISRYIPILGQLGVQNAPKWVTDYVDPVAKPKTNPFSDYHLKDAEVVRGIMQMVNAQAREDGPFEGGGEWVARALGDNQ